MSRRKIRDAEDAQACLEALEASGLALCAWSDANGVDPRSLNAWRLNRQRRERSAEAPVTLIEVVPTSTIQAPGTRYRVCYGALAVEVDEAFDEGVLRRLLAVVLSC
jgi:hypothetical protein